MATTTRSRGTTKIEWMSKCLVEGGFCLTGVRKAHILLTVVYRKTKTQERYFAGHFGPSGSEDTRTGSDARLGHHAAHSEGFKRNLAC